MDHTSRWIGLAFVLLWTIFRLVRYFKAGTSRTPATVSPIEPVGGRVGFAGGLAAVFVWLAGNAALWSSLFLMPALEQVPVMVRLVAGVLANFYLLHLARSVATSVRGRSGQSPPAGGNPIS